MDYAHQVYSKPVAVSPAIAAAFVRNRRPRRKHGEHIGSLISPAGILVDPKLFKSEPRPDARPTDKKRWFTTILLNGDAVASPEFEAMVDEAINAAVGKWPAASRRVEFSAEGRSFLRLGDGCVWLPFHNDADRGVITINLNRVDDPDRYVRTPEVIARSGRPVKQREIYSGVRARVSPSVFTCAGKDGRGVGFGLNNVQKLGDGPRLAAEPEAGR